MNKVIPHWNSAVSVPVPTSLTVTGSSHNVTPGFAVWGGTPPAPIIYTGSVIVFASGGTPPYTYLWTEVGGPSGIDISHPTQFTTNFREQSATGPYSKTGQFLCTVTDAAAATGTWAVDDVTIEQDM